jgi:hypothetical protein
MAKPTDLEGRFAQAMKKGERQDKAVAKKRSTSDGYMPNHKQLMKDPDYARQVGEGKQEERVAKSMPKKAPSWGKIMKENPNLKRDSKGNVSGK